MTGPGDAPGQDGLSGQDEVAARSVEDLRRGGLPERAVERLGTLRAGAYTSDLSVGEFAAVRSVGFDPVGQVLGTCVYQIGYAGTGWCNAGGAGYGFGGPVGMRPAGGLGGLLGGGLLGGIAGGMAGGGFPGGGIAGGTRAAFPAGPGAPGGSYGLPPAAPAEPLVRALRDARESALTRLRLECEALGGDGVVGVRLTVAPFPGANACLEFQAIGTAVRARGATRPERPFLSDLSGQDFAKLLLSGWVPCGLALGVAVMVRHDDWVTRSVTGTFAGNVEVPGYTALVEEARHGARAAFARDLAACGGHGGVVSSVSLRIEEQECRIYEGGRDHLAEATVLGTAVTPFRRSTASGPPTLPILRLNGRRAPRAADRVGRLTRPGGY